MSSNTDIKIRERREQAAKNKARNKRRDNSKINHTAVKKTGGVAIGIVAAVLVLALLCGQMGFTRRLMPAMRVGSERVNTAEFSYAYNNAFNNYYYMIYYYFGGSYMPFDTTKSLRKQYISADQTFSEYFVENAKESLTEMLVLYQEAKANNFELDEEGKKDLQDTLDGIKKTAAESGYTLNRYISKAYGMGMNYRLYKDMTTKAAIAAAYQEKTRGAYSYTEDDIQKYYNEHKADFDNLSIRYLKIAIPTDTKEEDKATALADAKEQADNFRNGISTAEEYAKKALEYAKSKAEDPSTVTTENTLRSNTTISTLKSTDENLGKWAEDAARKAGDCEVIEAASGDGYYIVYMVTPCYLDTYNTVDFRHILLKAKDASDDAEMDELKKKAEEILADWETKGTEEYFALLAKDKSEDNAEEGGLYTKVYKNQMVASINDWLFDSARKPGDTAVIETTYGQHVVYFVGESTPYWQVRVEDAARTADWDAYYKTASAKYKVRTNGLGIWLRDEPLG